MTIVVAATFDGATSGDATEATTGATEATGSADGRQHSTTQRVNGASVYFSGSAASQLSWDLPVGSREKAFVRMYVWRDSAAPTGSDPLLFHFRNVGNTQVARLRIARTTGNLMVANGSTTVAQYPTTSGQWYRVDWSVEVGIGQQVRLYTGAALHSSNNGDAVAGGELLAFSNSSDLWKFEAGQIIPATPPHNFYLDELVIDNAAMPAPYAAGRRMERKVSGAWAAQVVEKKVGGLWVPQIVERKDAGVWS